MYRREMSDARSKADPTGNAIRQRLFRRRTRKAAPAPAPAPAPVTAYDDNDFLQAGADFLRKFDMGWMQHELSS